MKNLLFTIAAACRDEVIHNQCKDDCERQFMDCFPKYVKIWIHKIRPLNIFEIFNELARSFLKVFQV